MVAYQEFLAIVLLASLLPLKQVVGQTADQISTNAVCINVTDTFEPISGQAQVPILHYDQKYFKITHPKQSIGYTLQQNGPTVDHTLMTDQGNYFIFSQYVCRGQNLSRTSVSTTEYHCPASSSSTATTCDLTFYYSMSGPYAGLLSFGTRFQSSVFLGDQRTGTGWKEHVIKESFPPGEPVQFIFNFTCNPRPFILNTRTLHNYAAGDIGLDDISITCRCPGCSAQETTVPLPPPTSSTNSRTTSPMPPVLPIASNPQASTTKLSVTSNILQTSAPVLPLSTASKPQASTTKLSVTSNILQTSATTPAHKDFPNIITIACASGFGALGLVLCGVLAAIMCRRRRHGHAAKPIKAATANDDVTNGQLDSGAVCSKDRSAMTKMASPMQLSEVSGAQATQPAYSTIEQRNSMQGMSEYLNNDQGEVTGGHEVVRRLSVKRSLARMYSQQSGGYAEVTLSSTGNIHPTTLTDPDAPNATTGLDGPHPAPHPAPGSQGCSNTHSNPGMIPTTGKSSDTDGGPITGGEAQLPELDYADPRPEGQADRPATTVAAHISENHLPVGGEMPTENMDVYDRPNFSSTKGTMGTTGLNAHELDLSLYDTLAPVTKGESPKLGDCSARTQRQNHLGGHETADVNKRGVPYPALSLATESESVTYAYASIG